jgi:hypothetical protein
MHVVSTVQDILYAITATGVLVTLWYVIPRPWRRRRAAG